MAINPTAAPATASSNGAGKKLGEPLLEVNNLVMHFPLTQGIIFQRKVGAVQAVRHVQALFDELPAQGLFLF